MSNFVKSGFTRAAVATRLVKNEDAEKMVRSRSLNVLRSGVLLSISDTETIQRVKVGTATRYRVTTYAMRAA